MMYSRPRKQRTSHFPLFLPGGKKSHLVISITELLDCLEFTHAANQNEEKSRNKEVLQLDE